MNIFKLEGKKDDEDEIEQLICPAADDTAQQGGDTAATRWR